MDDEGIADQSLPAGGLRERHLHQEYRAASAEARPRGVRRLPGKPAVFAAARHQDVSCAVFKEQAAEERAPL